jgi:cytochrome P450 family 142 subfamily A polypeptide 1
VPRAVEEMLRWVSPIKNMARTATRDVTLSGVTVPEGAQLLALYPSANRDETVFADPDAFDISRDPNPHLAFGFGTHFCLGNQLARLELKVMFEQLLARVPAIRLASPGPYEYRKANFVTGLEALPVDFAPSP